MQDFLLFVPYVNRLDLLKCALASVKPLWPRTLVIDNSEASELSSEGQPFTVFKPPIPLGFSQTQNLMQRLASSAKVRFFLFMHSDAICEAEGPQKMMDYVRSLDPKKWGAVFTNHDAFCCFNLEAVHEVGAWDWRGLPWYYADTDYYRRIKLAGFSLEHLDLQVTHEPSQTLHSDPFIEVAVHCQIQEAQNYYAIKWGGLPGKEIFETPFNGDPRVIKGNQGLRA